MRVFYDDYELSMPPTATPRTYYVKVDNVDIPKELKTYKVFEATTTAELINNIKEYYQFNKTPHLSIQLWSNQPYSGRRLDTLQEIPKENEFVWVRVVNKNS